ncbi:hypothetical protein Tco_0566455 [Tanacetum coccineum]
MISPFLSSYDSESDTEIPERHVSPTTSTPEIPTAPILPAPSAIVAPSSEFPLAPVVAPIGIRRRRAILIRPEEDIPIGRLYRTHPGGPYHFTSGSSLSHSSSNHSSSGHFISNHSLFGHTPPDTTDIDSSTPPRLFIKPSQARTPRCSGGSYLLWKSSDRGTMEVRVDMVAGIDIPDGMLMPNAVERLEQVEEGLQNIYDHVIEIPLQRIEDIKTGHRGLGARV